MTSERCVDYLDYLSDFRVCIFSVLPTRSKNAGTEVQRARNQLGDTEERSGDAVSAVGVNLSIPHFALLSRQHLAARWSGHFWTTGVCTGHQSELSDGGRESEWWNW